MKQNIVFSKILCEKYVQTSYLKSHLLISKRVESHFVHSVAVLGCWESKRKRRGIFDVHNQMKTDLITFALKRKSKTKSNLVPKKH